jgi:dUTP pyrophosphatase
MSDIYVEITKVNDWSIIPVNQTYGSAGFDLHSDKDMVIGPGERKLVPTGIKIAIPIGYEAQVRPRSGLALKKGITVLNTPGTIDADYRGEVGVILFNTSDEEFYITRGDRIAQMVVNEVVGVVWKEVDSLDETDRGSGGFGHTG